MIYKHSNGRVQFRKSNGQFFTPTLADLKHDANFNYQVCKNCSYGELEKWLPLLKTGICPKCQSQEKEPKKIPLTEKATELKAKIEKINKLAFPNLSDLNELSKLNREYSIELKHCINAAFEFSE
jgi:predicted nucleic-acid-binding Zn-ribbon protein